MVILFQTRKTRRLRSRGTRPVCQNRIAVPVITQSDDDIQYVNTLVCAGNLRYTVKKILTILRRDMMMQHIESPASVARVRLAINLGISPQSIVHNADEADPTDKITLQSILQQPWQVHKAIKCRSASTIRRSSPAPRNHGCKVRSALQYGATPLNRSAISFRRWRCWMLKAPPCTWADWMIWFAASQDARARRMSSRRNS